MKIEFAAAPSAAGAIAVPVYTDAVLSPAAQAIDASSGGAIKRAIAASRFAGKPAQTLEIMAPSGSSASRVVLFGLGDKDKRTGSTLETAAAAVVAKLLISGETRLSIQFDGETDGDGATVRPVGNLALFDDIASVGFTDGFDRGREIHFLAPGHCG